MNPRQPDRLDGTTAEPTPYTVVYTENKLRFRYYEARERHGEQTAPVCPPTHSSTCPLFSTSVVIGA
ncbi:hypothetical protein [Halocatena salina]|uniref:Uncharacterized protein n=1 Tax=Halocatena salina TaxID=2934340 RepID=A0A8U0A6D6_9EURY|nr:hypothetical protein [Halocatena salina]UPM44642.1 hypothetical protein MW046_16510 [Halocatena salina]